MRKLVLAALLAASGAAAQELPPGIEVDTIALAPGEVRAHFIVSGRESMLEIENATGQTLYFDALADRRGSGGFSPVPVASVPAGGATVAGRWAFPIATLTLGEFSYGPHGDHEH